MNPFVLGLLVLNIGAAIWFCFHGQKPWVLIHAGAVLIQAGTLWATR